MSSETKTRAPHPGQGGTTELRPKSKASYQGFFPPESNILLITNRKRKTGQGQSWDPPLEVGSGGCWQLPKLQGPFSKVLLGGKMGWRQEEPSGLCQQYEI